MKQRLTWRRPVPMLVLLAAISLVDLASAGGGYAIHNGTVAGGGSLSTNDCYSLVGTIGETGAGTVSNGAYRITSGFPATIGAERISNGTSTLFKDSFEGTSTGGCTP